MTYENFFIFPWTWGPKYSFTAAWWFVPTFFICLVANAAINRAIRKTHGVACEYCYMLIALSFGLYCVHSARSLGAMYGGKMTEVQMMIYKAGVLFPFFQFGHLVKTKWEERLDKIPGWILFLGLLLVELVMIYRKGETIGYSVIHLSNFPKCALDLYVVSIVGILLWHRLARFLIPLCSHSKVIKAVGQNTWTIMLHHQIALFVVQLIFIPLSKLGVFTDFDLSYLLGGEWRTYIPKLKYMSFEQIRYVYALLAISIPVICKTCVNNFIICVHKIWKKCN